MEGIKELWKNSPHEKNSQIDIYKALQIHTPNNYFKCTIVVVKQPPFHKAGRATPNLTPTIEDSRTTFFGH